MSEPSVEQLLKQAVELHRAGDLDGAERGYRQVLTIDPKHAEAMQLLGVVYATRQEFPQAISHFQSAIELRPGYALAHHNLGRLYDDMGDFPNAIESYRRAI